MKKLLIFTILITMIFSISLAQTATETIAELQKKIEAQGVLIENLNVQLQNINNSSIERENRVVQRAEESLNIIDTNIGIVAIVVAIAAVFIGIGIPLISAKDLEKVDSKIKKTKDEFNQNIEEIKKVLERSLENEEKIEKKIIELKYMQDVMRFVDLSNTPKEKINELKKIIDKYPNETYVKSNAYHSIAVNYIIMNNQQIAQEYMMLAALEEYPDSTLYFNYGLNSFNIGSFLLSAKYFEMYLNKINDKEPEPHTKAMLSLAYAAIDDKEKAISSMKKAKAEHPYIFMYSTDYIRLHVEKRPLSAKKMYDLAIKIFPEEKEFFSYVKTLIDKKLEELKTQNSDTPDYSD